MSEVTNGLFIRTCLVDLKELRSERVRKKERRDHVNATADLPHEEIRAFLYDLLSLSSLVLLGSVRQGCVAPVRGALDACLNILSRGQHSEEIAV